MANRRRTSLKRLYADLKDAPPNIASLEVTDTGFRVTFRVEPTQVHPPGTAATIAPAKFVPGTPFPDDDSPIDAADLTLHPPSLDDEAN